MSNSVRELFDLVLYSRPNAIDTVNQIRKQHNFSMPNYNGITGGAANINFTAGFANETNNYNSNIYFEGKCILKIANYLSKFLIFPIKNNDKLLSVELAGEILLMKKRFIQKDKIDEILNRYVIENKVPIEMTNDLRHRAGSALMSKYTGDTDIARMWGNLKEIRDLVIGKENDTDIDSRNNAIGRKIYLENKTATEKELIDIVYEGIKNNKQYNVKINETKIPLQQFLYFINTYTYKK